MLLKKTSLLKKALSLSLATGLAVTSAPCIFADNSQLVSDTSYDAVSQQINTIDHLRDLLTIPACTYVLYQAMFRVASAQVFCTLLSELMACDNASASIKLSKLEEEFNRLYKEDGDFKQAFDSAWTYSSVGSRKEHASIQCHPLSHGSLYWHLRKRGSLYWHLRKPGSLYWHLERCGSLYW